MSGMSQVEALIIHSLKAMNCQNYVAFTNKYVMKIPGLKIIQNKEYRDV